MNIFYLDENPIKCAEYHCDQHCVKMIIEYAQIMSTTHRVLDEDINDELYKKTHENHPSTIWCRKNSENYKFLYELFCALCDEYKKRYNKVHATDRKLRKILKKKPKNIAKGKFYPPPCAMPDEYIVDSVVKSYRNFYLKDKVRFAKWKNKKPEWF